MIQRIALAGLTLALLTVGGAGATPLLRAGRGDGKPTEWHGPPARALRTASS
jgi:hypothetical protein